MAILGAKFQKDTPAFDFIIRITHEGPKFEFRGGKDVAAERIGLILHKIFSGNFNSEIMEALERWSDDDEEIKMIKIVQTMSLLQKNDETDEKYCVHPFDVFGLRHIRGESDE